MKNKKLLFTILFGLLFAAAGADVFANVALNEAKSWLDPGATADDIRIALITDKETATRLALNIKHAAAAAVVPPVPDPKPTPNPVEKFINKNKTSIFSAGLGGYLGFAIACTLLGALTGGVLLLAFVALSAV